MALYTILFGISIFMIALVMTIIKKMYFHWKKEHKIERMTITPVDRPTVSVIISTDKCLLRRRRYAQDIAVYDVITRSDTSLPQVPISMSQPDKVSHSLSEEPAGSAPT